MAIYDPATDSDKMRALVQLAASIADPLANVASSLTAEADMLAKADASQHLPVIAALIKRSARRTTAIVSDLLKFVGQQPARPRVLSVADVLSDLTSLLRRLVGQSVTLTVDCAENIHPIYADPYQIEQIMCNLVARARDAMPDGGAVTIRVANVSYQEWADARDYVCIEIADTGLVVPSPQLERIFEPKLVRKTYGLWLGLSTVYGTITQMGGRATAESDPSNGSKFTILLPACSNR